MISGHALMSWWERMTGDRRSELLAHRHAPIRPDLALELWQDSGWLPVVRPGRWSDDVHRLAWRFSPEVEDFLAGHAHGLTAHPPPPDSTSSADRPDTPGRRVVPRRRSEAVDRVGARRDA